MYFIAEALPVYFSKNSPAQTRQVCRGWGGGLGFAYEGGLVSSTGFQILSCQRPCSRSLRKTASGSQSNGGAGALETPAPAPPPIHGDPVAQRGKKTCPKPHSRIRLTWSEPAPPRDGNTHIHTYTRVHGGHTLHAPCLLNKTTLISGFQPLLRQGGARKRSSFFKKDKASFFLC